MLVLHRGLKRKRVQKRASKHSAMNMLAEKYSQKAEIKKDELELRRMALEFAKEKYATKAEERKAKLEMEMQERRVIRDLSLLKDRL